MTAQQKSLLFFISNIVTTITKKINLLVFLRLNVLKLEFSNVPRATNSSNPFFHQKPVGKKISLYGTGIINCRNYVTVDRRSSLGDVPSLPIKLNSAQHWFLVQYLSVKYCVQKQEAYDIRRRYRIHLFLSSQAQVPLMNILKSMVTLEQHTFLCIIKHTFTTLQMLLRLFLRCLRN